MGCSRVPPRLLTVVHRHNSRKLDWEALRGHVEQHDDMTQKERARHFKVSRHCIWHALHKLAVTRKKRQATTSATRCKEEDVCTFVSGSFAAANNLSISMNAGLPRPLRGALVPAVVFSGPQLHRA
ncbi:MAG: hypothetical protein JSS39_14685 [Nitrospira sp.]|nr:hypothetical protein [Nitrospira sp.]